MKLLCTSDLHLGRRSSRIPNRLSGPDFSCAGAWLRIVELACRERVDLVLLGGDLIDLANRFYESFGPLEKGLAALTEAGVKTFAVAGNHDHESLADFAAAVSGLDFTLLGRGKGWEKTTFAKGEEELQIHGWSFTQEHHHENPMEKWSGEVDPAIPSIGIIHADLDGSGSGYAPVSREDLAKTGIGAWVVGHLHKPFLSQPGKTPLILVPGSPQAMDPGEAGIHGPWRLDIDQGRISAPVHIPLSTVRYEEEKVDLDGVVREDELKTRLIRAVEELRKTAGAESDRLELLSCRLILEGRTTLHGRLEALTGELVESLELGSDRPLALVEKIKIGTRPVLDLQALAQSGGLTALLAELILDQENSRPTPEQDDFVRDVTNKLSHIRSSGPYLNLDPDPSPGAGAAKDLIIRQGLLLLEELLAQKD